MSETCFDFLTGSIIGLMAWFFGGIDGFIKVLIALSVVDYLSGVAVAYVQHKICSRIGFKGILKKGVMFSLVGVANLIDQTFLGGSDAVRTAVVLFYVGNEGISIMENAYTLGVPFPKALQKHFLQFLKDEEEADATEVHLNHEHPSDGSAHNGPRE